MAISRKTLTHCFCKPWGVIYALGTRKVSNSGEHGVVVVRTEALRELEASIGATSASPGKPLTTTERKTLLTIIAALCDYSAIKHQDRGAAAKIATMTDEIGASVTDDTIRGVLAKIPDALAIRMK